MHNTLRGLHFLPWRQHVACIRVVLVGWVLLAGKPPYTTIRAIAIIAEAFFP